MIFFITTHLNLVLLNIDNLNLLLKEAFELSKSIELQGVYSWHTYARNILLNNYLKDKVDSCKNITDVSHLKLEIKIK